MSNYIVEEGTGDFFTGSVDGEKNVKNNVNNTLISIIFRQ